MGDKDAYGKVLEQFFYVSSRTKKRIIWLEKAIDKLEKAGIEILWIKYLYLPPNIIQAFAFEVKIKETVLRIRAYSRLNWRIYNPNSTSYRTAKTIEECIKEIESGKD